MQLAFVLNKVLLIELVLVIIIIIIIIIIITNLLRHIYMVALHP